jgi:hypothetical protein
MAPHCNFPLAIRPANDKIKYKNATRSCVSPYDYALGPLRRLCYLVPFFDEFGNIALILCANGSPISSFVSR